MKNKKNKYILIPKDLQKNLVDFLDEVVDDSKKRNLVATNSLIHKELLDLIKKKNIEKN